jgi:hypothetical protein
MNKNTILTIGVIGLAGYLIYKIALTKDNSKLFTLKKQEPTPSNTATSTNTATPKTEDDLLIAEIEKYKVLLEEGKFPAALWNNPKLNWFQSADTSVDRWYIQSRSSKKILYTMDRK